VCSSQYSNGFIDFFYRGMSFNISGVILYIQENHSREYNKAAFLKETYIEKVDTYVFRTIAILDNNMI